MQIYNNVGMQYLTSQCSAANLHCDINSQEYVRNGWGLFPIITLEYPSYIRQPHEEDLSQVLARKNELSDLKEIKNNLFTIMEEALSRPFLLLT
ncbi:hypothetical protein F8M41_006888 [Gigaspora margarita]|uniref:Uncharacterized protein n=1 Tax=Gigaspora margarita TaxID=4874 RepID=A0A8H3X5N8_GIGMA|nr:hypothetical protein F8M41_006888 [Gigaspora margarita]